MFIFIQQMPIVSSAPSSAYYSDLSTTGNVAGDRGYEVVGMTHLAPAMPHWECTDTNSNGRRPPRLAAINESSVPSDYVWKHPNNHTHTKTGLCVCVCGRATLFSFDLIYCFSFIVFVAAIYSFSHDTRWSAREIFPWIDHASLKLAAVHFGQWQFFFRKHFSTFGLNLISP